MSEQDNNPGEQESDSGSASQETPSNTGNAQPLSEIMEVHHHPDLHHKKKKFREYFLEFLMIFLAVTLGFFAEGLRENISERARAKEYALMLLKDVIKDTLELHHTMEVYKSYISTIDTLQQLRRSEKEKISDFDFYYYCRPAFTAFRMSFNDATLQQVKSSGNLRYFRSLKLKEKIGEYDNIMRTFSLRQEFELNFVPIFTEFRGNLIDYDAGYDVIEGLRKGYSQDSLKNKHYNFIIKNPTEINRFLNFCEYRKIQWGNRIDANINPTLEVARQLIMMLKKEFDFSQNE